MNIKVRNIPKGERKGTTKLENLPEFCITMYGAEREDREGLMRMLDGLGVRWRSGQAIFDVKATSLVVEGVVWVFFRPKIWEITHAPITWCEEDKDMEKYSLDYFKNLVEDYLYEHY